MHNRLFLPPTSLLTLLLAVPSGCHKNVTIQESASATDGTDLFPEDESTSEGSVPTTSVGEPKDADPRDYCALHPEPSFPGMNFACSGKMASTFLFDYYGDPDLPINELLVCFDTSDINPKDPGYVYTCYYVLNTSEFGPEGKLPGGRDIEACCLRDSPEEAVDAFCRIDAAQDFCAGLSNNLNKLRKEIPLIPKFKEVNDQLLNLNLFLATSEVQTDCASTLAKEFLATGDILKWQDSVGWSARSKMELDSEDGWPWFRSPTARVTKFIMDESVATGEACVDALMGLEQGELQGGQVDVSESDSTAHARVSSGRFAFRRSACNSDTCAFELQTLELGVDNFALAGVQFSDIHAQLSAPTRGDLTGTTVRLTGPDVQLRMTFKATVAGTDEGEHITVDMSADGEVTATVTPDGHFSIDSLVLTNWPVEMKLTTAPAPFHAAMRE